MRAGSGGFSLAPSTDLQPTFLASRAHRLDGEFDTYFMIALPHYAALATGLQDSLVRCRAPPKLSGRS